MTNGDPYPLGGVGGGPPAPRRRGPSWFAMVGVWVAVFALVWVLVRPGGPSPLHDPEFEARAVTPASGLSADELTTIDVFRDASPSVVHITSTERRRDLFSLNVFEIPTGTGSGFIYDDQGHVVTNFHVMQPGTSWTVRLADGSEWPARSVGAEADKDLAVLKVDAPPERLSPITLGSSKNLLVGQKVLAIGNPFGLDQTLTVGVVSATGREIESVNGRTIRDVIQTDAAINPGNSGGPLLDSAGRLIGVNTQIASPSGASAGIGFAVPVDTVNEVVPDLIRYGVWRRPGLGVISWDDYVTRRLHVSGVLIRSVSEGSGAAQAGLRGTLFNQRQDLVQLGDLIVKINDEPVGSLVGLKDALDRYAVGDVVQVTYVRDERAHTVPVELRYIN